MKMAPFFSARTAISFETLGSIVLLSISKDPGLTVLCGSKNYISILVKIYFIFLISYSELTEKFHVLLHRHLGHDYCLAA